MIAVAEHNVVVVNSCNATAVIFCDIAAAAVDDCETINSLCAADTTLKLFIKLSLETLETTVSQLDHFQN